MKKSPKQVLDTAAEWLTSEIKKRKEILNDEFMQSNLDALDLGMMEIEMHLYKKVLKKLKKK